MKMIREKSREDDVCTVRVMTGIKKKESLELDGLVMKLNSLKLLFCLDFGSFILKK